ncbi:alkanesulfonate monooxygenase [Purpureocillium lavendulum]|uniref:Alkanesulfonate monooxygenase n=1 Tax=Purpureocillium lavendulum TaxID=1247861 RepID=A0AB34FUN9_9HYPO|nr:alkanesulfonate monooxygenase [Purpureocillium lavendulum]
MADYDSLQWRETGRGVWTRDVDEVEMAYTALYRQWRGSGRSFFHITGHLSLKVRVEPGQDRQDVGRRFDVAISRAWTALRLQHPTIASQVKLDPQAKKYVKTYSANTEGWLDETLKFVSTGQTGAEWANSDPPAPALPTFYVVTPPSTDDEQCIQRDIVFRSPHDTIDGVGTLLLFDNFVRLAADAFAKGDSYNLQHPDEAQVLERLSPPFRIAAAIPPQPSEKILQRLEDLAATVEADALRGAEGVTLPYRKGAVVPGVHKRVETVLSTQETANLIAACKAVGATITHVVHAAIALALRDLQPRTATPRPVEYTGYLLRNERPRCNPPFNDHRHAVAVYHSVSSDKLVVKMTVPSDEEASSDDAKAQAGRDEFLAIVSQLRGFYLKVRDDPDHHYLAPLLWAKGTTALPTDPKEADAVPPVPPPAETATATISSMGRLDDMIAQKHGAIEVYQPWVTGEELRSSLGLFLGTFRGRLSLSAAYNDAWHDHDDVVKFVRRCLEIVNTGFGL